MNENVQKFWATISALALLVSVIGLVGGNNQPEDFGGTTNFDALTLDDGNLIVTNGSLTMTSGNITVTSGTLTATAGATSLATTSTTGFTQGGGCRASTTVIATETLTEAQMLDNNCFEYAGGNNAAAISITLPATSTMTTLLPNVGDYREWIFDNQYTAAATTTTIIAGTGIDLIAVTTADDVQDGGEWAQLTCIRQTDTDVTCIVSELLDAD